MDKLDMNKKAKELSKFYAELAENDNGYYYIHFPPSDKVYPSPNLDSNLDEFMVNPKLKMK